MKKLYIIHGWTYTVEPWAKTIELLKKDYGITAKMLHVPGLTTPSNKIWTIEELVKTNESKSHEETKSKIDYIISNYDAFMTNLKESQNIQISMFDFDFNYFYKFVIGKNENKPYVNLVSEEDDYPYSEIIQWIE